MLKELSVENWLSYVKERVEFPQNATVAVVGDNGHGKSGLLEAIPFALFGSGRYSTITKHIRNGAESMKIRLVLVDITKPGSEMVVERGFRASGAGYCKVWVDDVLMAKGGASPGNNKAQDFLNMALGTDADTFFLTSFFGLGSNDKLMQVKASERLDTMSALANTEICQKFHANASEKAKVLVQTVLELGTSIAVLEDQLADPEELGVNLEKSRASIERLTEERETIYARRNALLKDEDRYRKLVSEKDTCSSKQDEERRFLERDEKKLLNLRKELKLIKEDGLNYIKLRDQSVVTLASMPEADEMAQAQAKHSTSIGALDSLMNMKLAALEMEGGTVCVLCDSPLSAHSQEQWTKDIGTAKAQIHDHKAKLGKLAADVRTRDKLESVKAGYIKDIAFGVEESSRITNQGKALKKETDEQKAELNKTEARYLQLVTELGTFKETLAAVKALDIELETIHTQVGAAERDIQYCKEEISKHSAQVKTIKGYKKTLKITEDQAVGASLVKEAFSRYAIPVQLLRKIREVIEKRASRMYREFASGRIRIIDTEGARPGIEFVLEDDNGQREYKGLSKGEQVMVFISIRIALTEIINKQKDHKIQFLILDEVAGNLSPEKRDSLTRLINKLLRTYFPQVFMVSHVGLRDIFTKTFDVKKVDGVSHVG